MRIKLIFFFAIAIASSVVASTIDTVAYTYAGNFKAWVSIPDTPGKHPVLVYNYDEYFDWAGERAAVLRGYDIRKFMETFVKWGYICIVPIERHHKVNAIKGAVFYAEKMTQTDKSRIHLVGISEGAFLSMLTLDVLPEVASITLIAPITIHYSGYYSFPEALRKMPKMTLPILYLVGREDKIWKMKITTLLYQLLKQENKTVTYKEYDEERRFFWDSSSSFMTDIHQFIENKTRIKGATPGPQEVPVSQNILQELLGFAH